MEQRDRVPHLLVRRQLLLQLLRLLLDGAEVVLHRLAGVHPSVEAVVQPPPKPGQTRTECRRYSSRFVVVDKTENSSLWRSQPDVTFYALLSHC